MTEVPPCPSKHGPKARTTGGEPAGGCARGGGACCPQNGIGGSVSAVGVGVCADSGAATNNGAAPMTARTHLRILGILDWRAGRLAVSRSGEFAARFELAGRSVGELPGIQVNLDIAAAQVPPDELLRQRVFHVALNRAAQRTRAVRSILARHL